MRLTKGLLVRGALALVMGALAIVAAIDLDAWLGDWVGPVWLLSPFITAFVVEMALGHRAAGKRGVIIGAAIGVAVVALPSTGYVLAQASTGGDVGEVIAELELGRLWAVFLPLGALEGGLWGPLGATAGTFLRGRRRQTG